MSHVAIHDPDVCEAERSDRDSTGGMHGRMDRQALRIGRSSPIRSAEQQKAESWVSGICGPAFPRIIVSWLNSLTMSFQFLNLG